VVHLLILYYQSFSFQGLNPGPKNKAPVIGTASLNLAEFASAAEENELNLTIPVNLSNGATEPHPSLHVCKLYI